MVVPISRDFVVTSDDDNDDGVSEGFAEVSVEKVMSIGGEISEGSVVEVMSVASEASFFVVGDGSKDVDELVLELTASNKPSVLKLTVVISSVTEDCGTTSEDVLGLELPPTPALVTSLGNVEVDSDSVRSEVDSETFVVDGVVGRVTSGGHGLSFVVLPIAGRVVKIEEELSELDEISVEVDVDASDVKSIKLDAVDDDETSTLEVELILLES